MSVMSEFVKKVVNKMNVIMDQIQNKVALVYQSVDVSNLICFPL